MLNSTGSGDPTDVAKAPASMPTEASMRIPSRLATVVSASSTPAKRVTLAISLSPNPGSVVSSEGGNKTRRDTSSG